MKGEGRQRLESVLEQSRDGIDADYAVNGLEARLEVPSTKLDYTLGELASWLDEVDNGDFDSPEDDEEEEDDAGEEEAGDDYIDDEDDDDEG